MGVITVIADVVSSREITNRGGYQRGLQETLARLNQASRQDLLSPYTITLGDEFQAVYRRPGPLFTDILKILTYSFPHSLRFALAHGLLSTDINPEAAIGMDGPAFVEARRLLTALKVQRRSVLQLAPGQGFAQELLNMCLRLFSNELETWSRNSLAILSRLLSGEKVDGIAAALDISARAVYKNIRSNHLQDHVEMFSLLTQTLQEQMDNGGPPC